jgi:hypothetical protein
MGTHGLYIDTRLEMGAIGSLRALSGSHRRDVLLREEVRRAWIDHSRLLYRNPVRSFNPSILMDRACSVIPQIYDDIALAPK